jgi:hypothetical protein
MTKFILTLFVLFSLVGIAIASPITDAFERKHAENAAKELALHRVLQDLNLSDSFLFMVHEGGNIDIISSIIGSTYNRTTLMETAFALTKRIATDPLLKKELIIPWHVYDENNEIAFDMLLPVGYYNTPTITEKDVADRIIIS